MAAVNCGGVILVNVLPDIRWPGFRVGLPEDQPGFRISDDGSVRTGFAADPSLVSFGGHDPYGNPASAADPGSLGTPDASDGGVYPATDRAGDPIVGRPPSQDPARWTSNPAASRYVNASGNPSSISERFGPFLADVRDAAEAVGTRANAVVNGAYSVFPGTYNAIRAGGRGIGLLGPEEFRRFGQEADSIGTTLGQIAEHPGAAARVSRDALSVLDSNPLFRYYMFGRAAMGLLTGLGPAAMAGDALRAVEKGHNMIDAYKYGIQGTPSSGP